MGYGQRCSVDLYEHFPHESCRRAFQSLRYYRRVTIALICLDADDTLWHNMRHFDAAESALVALLASLAPAQTVRQMLQQIGARNLALYGFGAKSFTLSMIETATEVCGNALQASTVRQMLTLGRELLSHPVELLPAVETTINILAERARLILVTKGDLLHQEVKLAASGLNDRFSGIEILSDKNADAFRRIFSRYGVPPEHCVMAGDSVRSDIMPALDAGAWAAYVPHDVVWFYERAEIPCDHPRFKRLELFADLPGWIDAIGSS